MKIWLTTHPPEHTEGNYRVIASYPEFKVIPPAEVKHITAVKFSDYHLSMVCFYWLLDYYKSEFNHIQFIIANTDRSSALMMKAIVGPHMNKHKKHQEEVEHDDRTEEMGII